MVFGKGERHTGIFANMSFAEESAEDLLHQLCLCFVTLQLTLIDKF